MSDRDLHVLFDEVVKASIAGTEKSFEKYVTRFDDISGQLRRCPIFKQFVLDHSSKEFLSLGMLVLGMEMGRRLTEIENLEAMVGMGCASTNQPNTKESGCLSQRQQQSSSACSGKTRKSGK